MKQDLLRIIQYLDGDLSGRELEKFKQRLVDKKSTLEDIELLRQVDQFLAQRDQLAFRDALLAVQQNYKKNIVRRKAGRIALWATAASVMLLVGLFFWQKHQTQDGYMNALYSEYYRPYPSATLTRSASMQEVDLKKAYIAYERSDFQTAGSIFRKYLEIHPGSVSSCFFLGICSMQDGNTPEAIRLFGEVLSAQQNPYRFHAGWYLALAYLKNREPEKSANQLRLIKDSNSLYAVQADKLLQELKSEKLIQ